MTTTLPPPTFVPIMDEGPTLHGYASFVRRHRLMMGVVLLIGLAVGMMVHLTQPVRYTSTAHMVILATTVSEASESETDLSIDSAIQLLRSDEVLGHAAREVSYPGGTTALMNDLRTRPIINSRIVRVSVSALEPADAQTAVNAVVERFYAVRADGLRGVAQDRAGAVSGEIEAVEAELARRFGLRPSDGATAEERNGDEARSTGAGIAPLVTLRAQLRGELAALEIFEANPGYPSRLASAPTRGARSGFAITMASTVTLSVLAAVGMGALHQLRDRYRPVDTHPKRGALHDHL